MAGQRRPHGVRAEAESVPCKKAGQQAAIEAAERVRQVRANEDEYSLGRAGPGSGLSEVNGR